MNKKRLKIWLGIISPIAASGLVTGLVLGLKENKKHRTTYGNVVLLEEKYNKAFQNFLDKEQARINKLLSTGTVTAKAPLSSIAGGAKFTKTIADSFGVNFNNFDENKFEYTYYSTKKGIEINVQLKDDARLFSTTDPKIISIKWKNTSITPNTQNSSGSNTSTSPSKEDIQKQLSKIEKKKQSNLNAEQLRINGLTSSLKMPNTVIEPEKKIENEIFNESIANFYGILFGGFDEDKFAYSYDSTSTGIKIKAKINDLSFTKVLNSVPTPSPIQIDWITQQDLKKQKQLSDDQAELNYEQTRINKLETKQKSALNQPLKKDLVKDKPFDINAATAYRIDFTNFDEDKFIYKYSSAGDSGITIVPSFKDSSKQNIKSEIVPKDILIEWKSWYINWIDDYRKKFAGSLQSTKKFDEIDKRLINTKGPSFSRNVIELFKAGEPAVNLPNHFGVNMKYIIPQSVDHINKRVTYLAFAYNSSNHLNRLIFTINYE